MDGGFSVILPTFRAVSELDLCLASLEKNSRLTNEILVIVDPARDGTVNDAILKVLEKHSISHITNKENLGPYRGWNKGARMARKDILCFITDDQYFAPEWDSNILKYFAPDRVFTSQLVESGIIPVWKDNFEYNCGIDAKHFNERKFLNFFETHKQDRCQRGGFFVPLIIARSLFFDLGGFPEGGVFGTPSVIPNDILFIQNAEKKGFLLYRAMNSFSYHFQGTSWRNTSLLLVKKFLRKFLR